jgi:TPR repeat protein
MHITNDRFFDPRDQLRTLSEEEAVQYSFSFIDENCAEKDAAYLKQVIVAGSNSMEVTYQHALSGSPAAQFVYGTARLDGAHVEQCVSEGLFWLVRATNGGNMKAALVLAGVFLEGALTKRCSARAMQYATVAADGGLPEGKHFLANLLIGVDELPQDHERAIDLLQTASQHGYGPAMAMLEENNIPLLPRGDA